MEKETSLVFFIGRTLIYAVLVFVCVVGFWIYALVFAEERANYFSTDNFQLVAVLSLLIGGALAFFDPAKLKTEQERDPSDRVPKNTKDSKQKPSKTAKAGLALGAVALAKANQKPKFPVCTPRDGSVVRNIQTQHLGGNKWRVHCQTRQSANHWPNLQHDITPNVSGFSAGSTTIDVIWK